MAIDTSREAVGRLLDGVTRGPWYSADGVVRTTAANIHWHVGEAGNIADARFIAAARDLVPALLAERDNMATLWQQAEMGLASALAERDAAEAERDRAMQACEQIASRLDAALAEVARLSTPPDDAEVAALVKRLSGTPLYEGHGEASDAPDEAADALTRLSQSLTAIERAAYERGVRDALTEAIKEAKGSVTIGGQRFLTAKLDDLEPAFLALLTQEGR